MKKLALLSLALSLAACMTPPQTTQNAANPPPAESHARATATVQDNIPSHASADDCAVIAVVARGNRDTPRVPPMSSKSFGADCSWDALGIAGLDIAPPDPGPYYQGLRLFFRPPKYSESGSAATLDYAMDGNSGPGRYFFVDYQCRAEKRGGEWQFVSCTTGVIT